MPHEELVVVGANQRQVLRYPDSRRVRRSEHLQRTLVTCGIDGRRFREAGQKADKPVCVLHRRGWICLRRETTALPPSLGKRRGKTFASLLAPVFVRLRNIGVFGIISVLEKRRRRDASKRTVVVSDKHRRRATLLDLSGMDADKNDRKRCFSKCVESALCTR